MIVKMRLVWSRAVDREKTGIHELRLIPMLTSRYGTQVLRAL